MKKYIVLILLFGICNGSNSQNINQNAGRTEWLKQFSSDKAIRWKANRVQAESLAQKLNIPIRKLLADGGVMELQYIKNGLPYYYATRNLNAAKTISTDKVWPNGSSGYSLTGSTETLGIWDGGRVRSDHQEFQTNRVVQQDVPLSTSEHSTHVAGTMIAQGVQSNAKGMSYQAKLKAYDWDNDISEMADAAAAGLRVSNHSYGYIHGWYRDNNGNWHWYGDVNINANTDYLYGFYDENSQDIDNVAFNAPYYSIVKAAGNDRNYGPSSQPVTHTHWGNGSYTDSHNLGGAPNGYDCLDQVAVAKNIITVGAINDIAAGYNQPSDVVMSSFSSWGPTDDGRIKPDVVANGVDVYSCIATSNSSYGTKSGTSMATPNVSGSIGLLLQHYRNFYGDTPVRSSTIKALIIHTADEAGSSVGPDYAFGWGLMNTKKASDVIKKNYESNGANIFEFNLTQGNLIEFKVRAMGTEPLKATIGWIDPAGTPAPASLNPTTRMLVNDIDVRLINESGTTYFPYILNPASPSTAATTGDNVRDNVEQINIPLPSTGVYTVRISHKNSLYGGSQIVSLILTGHSSKRITFDQKLSTGQSIGQLRQWETTSFGSPKFPPFDIFNTDASLTIQGDQSILSGEKYQVWNNLADVTNHHTFSIDGITKNYTSNLRPVNNTTIQTQLIEGGGVGGDVQFKDPWLIDYSDPSYGNTLRNQGMSAPFKSVPYSTNNLGSGTNYKGVFKNLYQAMGAPNYYSVNAPKTQTIGTLPSFFVNWSGSNALFYDANALQTSVTFTGDNAIVSANYKAAKRSTTSTAFANNSARKVCRSPYGDINLVYESAGRIWYESINDYGTTATCAPLTGTGCKNPSITWVFDSPMVVYQDGGTIMLGRVNSFTGGIDLVTGIAATGLPSTVDLNPVIAGFDAGDFVIVWQEPQYGSTHPGGLYYVHGAVVYGQMLSALAANQMSTQQQPPPGDDEYSVVLYSWYDPSVRITNTDGNSKFPAISNNMLPATPKYHLAWQQELNAWDSHIKYMLGTPVANGGVTFSDYSTPSQYSGWPHNMRPSIVGVNNGTARMSWIGDEPEMGSTTVFKSTDYDYYWNFGGNVTSTSVNVSSDRYVVGWSESGVQKITDSRTLEVIKPLGITGNDIQLTNTASTSNWMYAIGYDNSNLPYQIKMSANVQSFGKAYAHIGHGRVGILGKDDAQFSFGLGDVTVDGTTIKFKDLPDTVKFTSASNLSQYLETKPFELTDASHFSYSVYYLVTDTAKARKALGAEGKVTYRVELIDNTSGQVIGVYNTIAFTQSKTEKYSAQGYEVSTRGIGSRTVRLRLVIQDNISPVYAIARKYATESVFLHKESEEPQRIDYNATMAVTEYALAQNYPNPFNPSTTISYAIPQAGVVTVKVFDLLGKEVATLVNEYKAEGRYNIAFDASRLSSGIYIYRIQAGKYSATRKMQLLK